MTNAILPKSLHTVTVLVNVALLSYGPGRSPTPRQAVKAALIALGYSDTHDTYGLADKAAAILAKRITQGGAQ